MQPKSGACIFSHTVVPIFVLQLAVAARVLSIYSMAYLDDLCDLTYPDLIFVFYFVLADSCAGLYAGKI